MPPVGLRHVFFQFILLGLFFAMNFSHPDLVFADSSLSYRVSWEGITDKKLRGLLEGISDTVGLREKPPASLNLLRRRVEQDIPGLLKALNSQGFYAATVKWQVDEKVEPIQVMFRVDPGPPYLLKDVQIRITGDPVAETLGLPGIDDMGLAMGERAENKRILDAGNIILRWIKRAGYPFPKMDMPKLLVDHGDKSVKVTFVVNPGPLARFGKTTVTGLKAVDEDFVRKQIPWKEGDRYNGDLLQTLQRRLINLGLFSVVRIVQGSSLDREGLLPVTIATTERKHRTIGAGVRYKTDEGFGAKFSWEHRNLFNRGDRLRVSGDVSRFTRSLEGSFRKFYFLRDDQTLNLTLRLADDTPDAYNSRNLVSSIRIDRKLKDKMTVGAGLAFKKSDVEQLGIENKFSLLSLPLIYSWDTSDNLLDPTRGGRLGLQAEPFIDISNTDLTFAKGLVSYRRYYQISKKPFSGLAGRITLGTIVGAERDEIPADERLYAGGGSSIRGYAYQFVGPIVGDTPIGGRSLLELSFELRLKLTDSIGLVGFLDGGTAYSGTHFNTDEKTRWGVGPGLRYFTPIGPLRLDVGFPLDRREGIDDAFQIYLSIGQAF